MYKCLMTIEEAQIAASRVMQRCNELAKISEIDNGITRVYLSAEHLRANTLVGEWMVVAGLQIWQDAVGNICGRYEGEKVAASAILLGSHLDTVHNAGRYDGILGVLSAIEIVSWLNKHKLHLPLAIEVIGFCDEEGIRFSITLLGSRALTGTWEESWITCKDSSGITIAEAMKNVGLDASNISAAKRNIKDITAYLELHIEQGPCLYKENIALGVVTGINGARRLNCSFIGKSGHAGTLPMHYRKDALSAAAEWIVFVEHTTKRYNSYLVATVGKLHCSPGSVNVIPGEVHLTLDIRGPEDVLIEKLLSILLDQAHIISLNRGLRFYSNQYYRIDSTVCDDNLKRIIEHSVKFVQNRSITLSSGAGHDAVAIAERWPVAMLFVRCDRGISHHPKELVTENDVALGIQAYMQAIYWIAKKK
ncbi:allantoate amidohydrolase [Candidatus Ishikawella capsulata]|uniref:N-carbamoyl-L-amino acid amidohydrolase n=1 Tax=Candidatus Ishikawaella capsulata Mpkobe TaxID=476281 RepID=C5WDF2_9ENTR|nr:allantoate amidohydrolase [Candidatus Ishikawaella capsulata]BAH83358.1 N-carbamoyl-L-amino acid amidohydrolase [Candidatus Ishikawaella capsulata Mpkobe]